MSLQGSKRGSMSAGLLAATVGGKTRLDNVIARNQSRAWLFMRRDPSFVRSRCRFWQAPAPTGQTATGRSSHTGLNIVLQDPARAPRSSVALPVGFGRAHPLFASNPP